MESARAFDINRRTWDTWTNLHLRGGFYDVDGFRAGGSTLTPIDLEALPDVRDRTLLHLQCHFGLDTLSWARRGARVTGVDFSPAAIGQARALALECDLVARFVESNVYDVPAPLAERFDIIYVNTGAINWLPDLDAWARVIAAMLAPGGTFFMFETHPMLAVTVDLETPPPLRVECDYFDRKPIVEEQTGSYGAPDSSERTTTVSYLHGLQDVFGAVLRANLRIVDFREHDCVTFPAQPWFEPDSRAPRLLW